MIVEIEKSVANGVIMAPPSKSMAHRLLICAALAKGTSKVSNIQLSADIQATIECLKALGAGISIDCDCVTIEGTGGLFKGNDFILPCNECGSTLRFFAGIMMASGCRATLTGSKKLISRPMEIYEDLCRKNNISYIKNENSVTVEGTLKGGCYSIPGDISSQFITGLLYCFSMLKEDSTIIITGKCESRSYINMTISALKMFGIDIEWKDEHILFVKGAQTFLATDCVVEGDYSNAAFLDGFNMNGGSVLVKGLFENSLQGDSVYKDCYERMKSDKVIIDISDCPDLGPVLMAVAAANHGVLLTGTRRLAFKESNRGVVMKDELDKFGISTVVSEDSIEVEGGNLKAPNGVLCGHNDHRIVMALSLLLCITGGRISEAEAVNKSYPTFFEDIKTLGIKVKENA